MRVSAEQLDAMMEEIVIRMLAWHGPTPVAIRCAVEQGYALRKKLRGRTVIAERELVARSEIKAALSAKEGMMMVPEEPTEEMMEAGAKTGCFDCDYPNYSAARWAKIVWKAMLSAAPRQGKGK